MGLIFMNKIIFITGGSKGIGAAIVKKFCSEGYLVVFSYNTNKDAAEKICSDNTNCHSYQCELRDKASISFIINDVKEKFGNIDILVNNAGYDHDSLFTKMEGDDWDEVIDINLKSIFNFTKPIALQMVENKWGRIINLTSIAGLTGAFGKSNYATAKAGIIGFTKSLALELASKGITVNAVAPGAIDTDMYNRIPEKYRDVIISNIPCKRVGKPDEVAELVLFLASEKASYINGQTIHINGGSYFN